MYEKDLPRTLMLSHRMLEMNHPHYYVLCVRSSVVWSSYVHFAIALRNLDLRARMLVIGDDYNFDQGHQREHHFPELHREAHSP